MERNICIHGHFYQPPRENPWLEAIELQDSAYPYHDWNERILSECYMPNAASRILDDKGWIVHILNNYTKISFDVGPTLLAWMAEKAPDIYQAILQADRESQSLHAGHGSALAQAYSHMIMPLANRRDKYTQIVWGIRDFEARFNRMPEGMWLPETAVDLETLDLLAELGIRFTILAPHQARRVRRIGSRSWRDVSNGRIDPSMPYLQRLPSRRSITVFFYDSPVSHDVAFAGLLARGDYFAERLVSAFSETRPWPQLVHIATDGETYGHHHRHGDMALAYALNYIESNQLARLTNYAEYLAKHQPTHMVEIVEHTSWSCAHGVERWCRDCGCHSGRYPEWHQAWREPLRQALDWLRDTLAPTYEQYARQLFRDPWEARNDYISVILDRSEANLERFLHMHAVRPLDAAEIVTALKLLELQRHAMLMYTSCGWFFDELSGIETLQILQYAGRAIQLAEEVFDSSIEARFLERLEQAPSNVAEHRNGRQIYDKFVRSAMVNWERAGAHYAVSSLFETFPERTSIYCYAAELEDFHTSEAGMAKLAVGRVRLTSKITQESTALSFGVLHFGDHHLNGGVRRFEGDEMHQTLVRELAKGFAEADFGEVIRLMDRHFGTATYALRSLFHDEQRTFLNLILTTTLADDEAAYRQIYEKHTSLMRFLTGLRIPLPSAFLAAAEYVLNIDLRRAFEAEELDPEGIASLLEGARLEGVPLDGATLEYALRQSMERLARQLEADPDELALLQRLEAAAGMARGLPFEVELSKVQNVCYALLLNVFPSMREKAARGDIDAQLWLNHLRSLADKLSIRVD